MAPKSVVYLPIEYRSREFDGKLALATKLTQLGFVVVIGQQWAMYENFQSLPAGVVLFKSTNKIHNAGMYRAKVAGHIVATLEEETLALISHESILRNCPTDTYQFVDFLLTTGEVEKQAHAGRGCDPRKLLVTGNPRVDVLKPLFRPLFQDAIDQLRARFGDYVLLNTNFGYKNSRWGSIEAARNIEINAGSLNPADPESVRQFDDMVEWEEENCQAMFETVTRLAGLFPDRTFIVRPHPIEDVPKVTQQYASIPNVKVIQEGPHIPWTLGCAVMLHTSCTTGLEAAIAGKQTASLVTTETWASRAFLSNKVNPVFSTVDAIVENTKTILSGGAGMAPPPLASFENHIRNIGSTSAIDLIVDFLRKLPYVAGEIKFNPFTVSPRHQILLEKCRISPEDMKAALKKMAKVHNLPAGAEFPVMPMGDSLFLLPPLNTAVKQS